MYIEEKVYKNYSELCNSIGWKTTTGKAKQLQLKDLERYCTYNKVGNKFIIDKVFDVPIEKIDNRNKFCDNLEKLIMHNLSMRPLNRDGRTISLAKNTLYFQLHLINRNYNKCRNNINRFSRYIEVPTSCVYDFYNNTSSKLRDNVERCLNKLQSKCLIKWEYREAVRLKSGTSRLANEYEVNTVLEAERTALKCLDENSKRDVFIKGRWNEFQSKKQEELKDTNIMYSFKVFHINTTKDFRQMLIDERELSSIQSDINSTMYLSAKETAEKKHIKVKNKYKRISVRRGEYYDKPYFESDEVRFSDDYIEYTQKIADKVIEFDTFDIDLSDISNEKYTLFETLWNDDWGDVCSLTKDNLEELFG